MSKKNNVKKYVTFNEHVERIEKQMGMSVSDFHDKLDELITPEYIAEADYCKEFLDNWLENGEPIYTLQDHKELHLRDEEYFVPCFVPDKAVRKELPIHWFYSNYDNLVSVYKSPYDGQYIKVIWLRPKEYDRRRGVQGFTHKVTNKHRTIRHHALGGLIMNEENITTAARELLELFGSYAFGGDSKDLFYVQAHHEYSAQYYTDKRYDHENICILTTVAHDLMRANRKGQDFDLSFIKEFVEAVEAEEPGMAVVFLAGAGYDFEGNYVDTRYYLRAIDQKDIIFPQNDYLWNLIQSCQKVLAK